MITGRGKKIVERAVGHEPRISKGKQRQFQLDSRWGGCWEIYILPSFSSHLMSCDCLPTGHHPDTVCIDQLPITVQGGEWIWRGNRVSSTIGLSEKMF